MMNPPDWYLKLANRQGVPNLQHTDTAYYSGRAAALHGIIITSAVDFVNRNQRYGVEQTRAYIKGYDSVAGTDDEMAIRAARYSGYQHSNSDTPVTDGELKQVRKYTDAQINAYRDGETKHGSYGKHNEDHGPSISLKPVFAYLFSNRNVVGNNMANQGAEPMQIAGAQNQPIHFNNTLLPAFQTLLNGLPPAPNPFYIAGYNYGRLGIPNPDFLTFISNCSIQDLSEFNNGFKQALLETNTLTQAHFAPAYRM